MKSSVALLLMFCAVAPLSADDIGLYEPFNSLTNWTTLPFPGIERHSTYEIVADQTNSVLHLRPR